MVCDERSEKLQQGDIVLLRVNIELRVLDGLDPTFDPLIFHASEIDATHANQQAFRLNTVHNTRKMFGRYYSIASVGTRCKFGILQFKQESNYLLRQ